MFGILGMPDSPQPGRPDPDEDIAAPFIATGKRPLTHIVRDDSRTIPGVIMAAIWMRIRKRIQGEMPEAEL